MNTKSFLVLVLSLMLTPVMSQASTISCGFSTIEHVYVNGDRDDSSVHSNRLLIAPKNGCNGQALVYIENTSPAYSSFLSMALAAFSSGEQVRIYVNESKTNQIEFMELKKIP